MILHYLNIIHTMNGCNISRESGAIPLETIQNKTSLNYIYNSAIALRFVCV